MDDLEPLPNRDEIRVLAVLWKKKKTADAEYICRVLQFSRDSGQSILDRMAQRGLITKSSVGGSAVYAALVREKTVTQRLVEALRSQAESFFSGSIRELAQHALDGEPATDSERTKINELIKRSKKPK